MDMKLYDVCGLSKEQILNAPDGMLGKYAVQLQRVDNKVKGIGLSIGEKVHAKAHLCQREAVSKYGMDVKDKDTFSPAANKAATTAFLAWYVVEERAAKDEMTPEEVKKGVKKSASAMDSAYRKLKLGLENGCDLSDYTTTNQVQNWNKEFNDSKEEREKEDARRSLLIAHGIDPDKEGLQGVDGGKEGGEEGGQDLTPIQLQMSKLAEQMQELSDLKPDQVKDKLASLEGWISEALTDAKAAIGDRIASGG